MILFCKTPPPPSKTQPTKVLNSRTLKNLYNTLQYKTWENVFNALDPDTAYESLINELHHSIQTTIPEKTVTSRSTDQNPWLTKGILNLIKHKNKLYKKYIKQPTICNKNKYNTFRNKLTNVIRKSKCDHYTDQLRAAQGDTKRTWSVLNKVLNREKKTSVLPEPTNLSH